jgi:hypothetical protein
MERARRKTRLRVAPIRRERARGSRADAIQHYTENAILGDPVSVSLVLGLLGWVAAMIAAAIALRGAGTGWPATVLVGAAALFAVHPPPVGPAALVCFAAAALLIDRWRVREAVDRSATAT